MPVYPPTPNEMREPLFKSAYNEDDPPVAQMVLGLEAVANSMPMRSTHRGLQPGDGDLNMFVLS